MKEGMLKKKIIIYKNKWPAIMNPILQGFYIWCLN